MKPYVSYDKFLVEQLKDPALAAGYLNAALEGGDCQMFFEALRNVAKALGGLSKLSSSAKLNRANLYRILSKQGNPEVQTLSQILETFGLRLAVTANPGAKARRAA